jgi:hypothetical protein
VVGSLLKVIEFNYWTANPLEHLQRCWVCDSCTVKLDEEMSKYAGLAQRKMVLVRSAVICTLCSGWWMAPAMLFTKALVAKSAINMMVTSAALSFLLSPSLWLVQVVCYPHYYDWSKWFAICCVPVSVSCVGLPKKNQKTKKLNLDMKIIFAKSVGTEEQHRWRCSYTIK